MHAAMLFRIIILVIATISLALMIAGFVAQFF